jgi:cbb3-type cytochrome oxidase maturation protein
MEVIAYLIPLAILLGAVGLAAFFWALRNGQYEDPDGAAERILFDDEDEESSRSSPRPGARRQG